MMAHVRYGFGCALLLVTCSCSLTLEADPRVDTHGVDAHDEDAYIEDARIDDVNNPDAAVEWFELENSAHGGGVTKRQVSIYCARLAVDSAGTAYVAWADRSEATQQIYLRYWDGSNWAALAQSDSNGGVSQGAGAVPVDNLYSCLGNIAFDARGRPDVSWMNYDGSKKPVYLRRYEQNAWQEVFASASVGLSTDSPTWWPNNSVDSQGRALVTWSRASEIYLVREDVQGWIGLANSHVYPGIIGEQPGAGLVSAIAGPDDHPYVVWTDSRYGLASVFFIRWDGAQWQGLVSATEEDLLSDPAFACSQAWIADNGSGRPIVLWAQEETASSRTLQLRQWDGVAWQDRASAELMSAGLANASARDPVLSLNAAGQPVIAWWQDDRLGSNVYAAQLTPDGWMSLSPDVGGVSASTQRSSWPRVATAPDGRIFIIWEEEIAPGMRQLYLRYAISGTD